MVDAHMKPQQLWLPTGDLHKIKPARTQIQTGTQESLPAAEGLRVDDGHWKRESHFQGYAHAIVDGAMPMQIWVALILIMCYFKSELKPEGTGGGG